jgi:hypothetical protein
VSRSLSVTFFCDGHYFCTIPLRHIAAHMVFHAVARDEWMKYFFFVTEHAVGFLSSPISVRDPLRSTKIH